MWPEIQLERSMECGRARVMGIFYCLRKLIVQALDSGRNGFDNAIGNSPNDSIADQIDSTGSGDACDN